MKPSSLLLTIIILSVPVLAFQKQAAVQLQNPTHASTSAENASKSNKSAMYQGIQSPNIQPELASHAAWLNEISQRRRGQTLARNPQPGLFKGFVHVAKGNVSFARSWLVTAGRLPINMKLVYDSASTDNEYFGQGWFLSYSERIETDHSGNKVLKDHTGTRKQLTREFSETDDKLILHLPDGMSKTFTQIGQTFKLQNIRDRNQNQLTFHYENELLTKITADNGHFVTLKYDNGRVTRFVDSQKREVALKYDQNGRLTSVNDIGSNRWRFDYNNDGQLLRITDPEQKTAARFKYFENGRAKLSKVRALTHRFKYQADTTTVKTDGGIKTIFNQDTQGRTTSVTNAKDDTYKVTLNNDSQVTRFWHNGDVQAELRYNDNGQLSKMETSEQSYSYHYNNKGSLHQVFEDSQLIQRFEYDDSGNLTVYKTPKMTFYYQYSAHGDILKEKTLYSDQTQTITTYQYNNDGLVTLIQNDDNKTHIAYSPLGQIEHITFPDGISHKYSYNDLGFRKDTVINAQNMIDYRYDTAGNLLTLESRQVTQLEGTGKKGEMRLNENGQTSFVKHGTTAPMEILYHKDGQPKSITIDKLQFNYQYDILGRLIAIYKGQEQLASHQYAANEPDIRWQLDTRTQNLSNLSYSGSSQDLTRYVRGQQTPWSHIAWSEDHSTLSVLTPFQVNNQHTIFQASKHNRRLYDAKAKGDGYRTNFDKPSNAVFSPPEYIYDNCWIGHDDDEPQDEDPNDYEPPWNMDCSIYSLDITGPSHTNIGQQATFTSHIVTGVNCMNPVMTFSIAELGVSGGWTSNQFSYAFNNPGSYTVKVEAVCSCNIYSAWDIVNIIVRPPVVEVINADITNDRIDVKLAPLTASGNLVISLMDSSGNAHPIYSGVKSGGTHTLNFNIPNLPKNLIVQNVRATWQVGNSSIYDQKQHKFKVLGDYRHSQYNTPAESSLDCKTGGTQDMYITTGGHAGSQCFSNNTLHYEDTFAQKFIDQVDLNGSGDTILYDWVQIDGWCPTQPGAPAAAIGNTYRMVNVIRPGCGAAYGVNDATVAARKFHSELSCGDQVYIHGHGIKTVTDYCPDCPDNQLDNYLSSESRCTGIPDLNPSTKTIKLLQ